MFRLAHEHEGKKPAFNIRGCEHFKFCTCEECGEEVGLDEAFNAYFNVLDRIIKEKEET